jgi:integrase/recombinase XerD
MTDQSFVETTAHISGQTSFASAIDAWAGYLKDQGRSLYTVKAFKGDLQMLGSHLGPNRPVGSVTTIDLEAFLKWLQSRKIRQVVVEKGIKREQLVNYQPKSNARRITSFKSFFRWLRRYGAIAIDPAEKIVQKSVISPLPEVLSKEEVNRVLDAAFALSVVSGKEEHRPYTLVGLLLQTGIKKGECLKLKLNHIDVQADAGPFLFVRYPEPGNRFKERKIALGSEWVEIYKKYLEQYLPREEVFPWSPRRLEYILQEIGENAALDTKRGSSEKKQLSFDMCRWTCALIDWDSGVEPDKIRQKLGISKIQWYEVRNKLHQLSKESPTQAD